MIVIGLLPGFVTVCVRDGYDRLVSCRIFPTPVPLRFAPLNEAFGPLVLLLERCGCFALLPGL